MPDFCLPIFITFGFLFHSPEMKFKKLTRVSVGLTCFVILVQTVFCRLYTGTNTQFCCEETVHSSGFRCWKKTVKENGVQDAWKFYNCSQHETEKACFNVTELHSCPQNYRSTLAVQEKRRIHIGTFVPFLREDRYGYFTAMKMAIDIINNRSDILDNYTLVLDSEDTFLVSTRYFIDLNDFTEDDFDGSFLKDGINNYF